MKKILLAAMVLAIAAIAVPAAMAGGEHNDHPHHDDGAPPDAICVGGGLTINLVGLPPDLVAILLAALERGTAWTYEVDGQRRLTFSNPVDIPGATNIKEVSVTAGRCAPGAPGRTVFVPMPARVAVCSPQPMLRGDGSMGIYHDIPIAQWLDKASKYFGMPAAKYAKGGPVNGTTCDNLPGYRSTGRKVDASGLQQGGDGQVYDEYVFG